MPCSARADALTRHPPEHYEKSARMGSPWNQTILRGWLQTRRLGELEIKELPLLQLRFDSFDDGGRQVPCNSGFTRQRSPCTRVTDHAIRA
jgi:hypothetical protein